MQVNPFLPRRAKRLSDHFLLARIRAYRRALEELRGFEGDFARRTKAHLEEAVLALESEVRARQGRTYAQRVQSAT